jgi:AcrR family transcriptional regulator
MGKSEGPRRPVRRDAGRARGATVAAAVLACTLEELASAGLEGMSLERIARRAEVNKTSIYRRWPTRGALVAAALEGVLDGLAAAPPDTGSLRGDLLALLGAVASLLQAPVGLAVARAALSAQAAPEVAALAGRKLREGAKDPLRALVARAKQRGEWRAGADGVLLVNGLIGALLHRALLEHAPLSPRWRTALVEQALLGVLRPAGVRR